MLQLRFISAILIMCIISISGNNALSWEDGTTHKSLAQYASENSVLSKTKGDYLKILGFNKGLKEELKWNDTINITQWLQAGAGLEDTSGPYSIGYIDGKGRSFNHFLNPLNSWAQAGLNDIWIGEASVLWAQDGAYQENFYEGNWSWQKVREYFYAALTGKLFNGDIVAPDEPGRKAYFARTFRGLGHQMHLVQDTAVPDHVRNDAHPEDSIFGKNPFTGNPYFESWAKANYD